MSILHWVIFPSGHNYKVPLSRSLSYDSCATCFPRHFSDGSHWELLKCFSEFFSGIELGCPDAPALFCCAIQWCGKVLHDSDLLWWSEYSSFFHHLFVFTVFKKLMLAEKQKPAGLFFHANKQDTCVFLSKSWTIFWEKMFDMHIVLCCLFFLWKNCFCSEMELIPGLKPHIGHPLSLGTIRKASKYEFYREAVFLALFPDSSFEVLISL